MRTYMQKEVRLWFFGEVRGWSWFDTAEAAEVWGRRCGVANGSTCRNVQ